MKAIIELTDQMVEDRKDCGEDSDCENCACRIGDDLCIYEFIEEEGADGEN